VKPKLNTWYKLSMKKYPGVFIVNFAHKVQAGRYKATLHEGSGTLVTIFLDAWDTITELSSLEQELL
jgi:hypothetical protein